MGDGRALIARNRLFYPLFESEPRVFTTLLVGVSESVCEICAGSFFLWRRQVFSTGKPAIKGRGYDKTPHVSCLLNHPPLVSAAIFSLPVLMRPDKKVISRR